jgi:hypothetical protein
MHGYVLADAAWLVTGTLGSLAAAWHPPVYQLLHADILEGELV